MNVLTIISPKKQKLESGTLNKIEGFLNSSNIKAKTSWLKKDEAIDSFFSEELNKTEFEKIATAQNFDFIFQPEKNRRKKMLISDMDSTIITIECIDEIADYAGVKPKVAEITERAMNGELDFAAALNERVALLKGLPVSTLEKVYNERLKFMPGAKELVGVMAKSGARCVLVSGGFTFFTNKVREELGFTFDESNNLEVENGKLTGRVIPPILDKNAKLASLKKHAKEIGISAKDVIAVGDGANDLPMLLEAGLGVAYHAKESVKKQAAAKIDVCDLTSLLYAQGYQVGEIEAV